MQLGGLSLMPHPFELAKHMNNSNLLRSELAHFINVVIDNSIN
jgi:hypothetical protein